MSIWEVKHFKHACNLLIEKSLYIADERIVIDLLNAQLNHSEASANLFVAMSTQEKLELVKNLLQHFGRSSAVQHVLSQRYYAPYLLVQLIDKQIFMKEKDHSVFSQCLSNSSSFELEELSKLTEIEESFVKFLKHIEILNANDPSKVEGQKLISLIFNIDKYKAYQNVSLQLFDQESVIFEEEAITA